MKNVLSSLAVLAITASASELGNFQCAHCAAIARIAAEAKAGEGLDRKYAPDRLVDIHHLKLEVTPNFETRSIEATATLDFQPIAKPLRQLTLNAAKLNVVEVSSQVALEAREVTDDKITLTFADPIAPGRKNQVSIRYRVEPKEGLYFRTEAMGYPKGDTQLWTQGEPESHRFWFPSHDYPNEKFTTEVICHVPQGMMALSNGRLLSETKNDATGLTSFHWLQDKPHVNYLISLAAGYFHKTEDKLRDIPIAILVPPSEKDQAANSFRDTKKILEFFEKEIGVPYPWDKYYNVCAIDYMMGGMENTSITTLTARTLFPNEMENLRSTRGLDAHEAAHQWFGDLVTCQDWSHLWLNEGFATYYSSLYEGREDGPDFFKHDMLQKAEGITANANDTIPIVHNAYGAPMEQFSFRAYPKGAWVLHMLRHRLGEELYRAGIKTYLERNRFRNVVTQDLAEVLEEVSGQSLSRFFDQWVYLSGTPELHIKYAWNELSNQVKLSVAQTQAISEKRPLFHFSLPVRFRQGSKTWNEVMEIDQKSEDFYFSLSQAPETVRVDPEVTVLAKIQFEQPRPMLLAQVADPADAIGRLLAVRELAKDKSRENVEILRKVLAEDAFFATRIEAAEALAAMQMPEALTALTKCLSQSDARAREAVVKSITRYYHHEAESALRLLTEQEANPLIKSEALRGLARYAKPELRLSLLGLLQSSSYQHQLAVNAIEAMRLQDDPFYVEPVLRELEQNEAKFDTNGFASGLQSLAYLTRKEENKERVLDFLLKHVDHPKDAVANSAVRALGTLGESRALAILDTIASGDPKSAKSKAAQEAAGKLRAAKPIAPEEVAALRAQVFELQRQLKSTNDELKAAKDQFKEAIGALRKQEKEAKKAAP